MSKQKQWLESNYDSINWRVVGPNLKNRFDSATSDEKLDEYSNDRSLLMDACSVQATMDDAMILKVTNLVDITFTTEHPYLVGLDRQDLDDFFKDKGLWDKISEDLSGLQQACLDELEERKAGPKF